MSETVYATDTTPVPAPTLIPATAFVTPIESLRPGDDLTKQGVKFDNGKFSYSQWLGIPFSELIPVEGLRAVATILGIGAKKYAPRNWEQGMAWSRPLDATLRHLNAWWGGEDKDPDTGKSHLWHAACNIFFLIAYEARGAGTDDRTPPVPVGAVNDSLPPKHWLEDLYRL